MFNWTVYILLAVLLLPLGLLLWRLMDRWQDARACKRLSANTLPIPIRFSHEMLDGLPEVAQRYFCFVIEPGTPLCDVATIEMSGELGLGTKEAPNYKPMYARQILAPPHGLVWQVKSGAISGSDGLLPDRSWTRFWLFNLMPVARISGSEDHRKSAFGRLVAESAFWSPAALLPSENVSWVEVDHSTARATVRMGDLCQSVDISVADNGQPVRVVLQRWSNENKDREYRWQPFGGTLSDFRLYDGYRLPSRVEGGNLFGTEDYYPFFKARVQAISMT